MEEKSVSLKNKEEILLVDDEILEDIIKKMQKQVENKTV
nr:MAG TPA: hypothetical protein [Caudoviricetes sp.]